MLFPIRNNFRNSIEVTGLWKFKPDPNDIGEQEEWFQGFESDIDIAVPGSWNEQLEEFGLMHYVGPAWFSKSVFISRDAQNKNILLRIGSADYHAKVWINGTFVGEHHFGFIPFEFQINKFVQCGEIAQIVICVDNRLSNDSIPQGINSEQYETEHRLREETFPPARFDFTPFGGIHRPVQFLTIPLQYLDTIKVDTTYSNGSGSVSLSLSTKNIQSASAVAIIKGGSTSVTASSTITNNSSIINFALPDCHCWSPEDPFLYELTIQVQQNNQIVDEYLLSVGIREIKIDGNKLLLNGKEIYLKGFGKHEDFYVIGKGLSLPLMVKDFAMMKWINANSFRTSHYPYAEEMMFYADKKGILVIDEVPAVSLDFRHVTEKSLANHKEFIRKLIERDHNHPSVIIWALGNEPNLVGEPTYTTGKSRNYWKEVFDTARSFDSSRPLIVPNCLRAGIDDPVMELSDIVCINRYYGWYEYPGQLVKGIKVLEIEMDAIFKKYRKPMMMTEFGADTIPGFHSTSDQMFTEEYQEKLILMYIQLIRSKSYMIGEHVWNFADFRAPQNMRRVVLNMKGVFTRNRSPKQAAFLLKKIWADNTMGKV
ncbi:MAG: beta-glucuronidase [Bacteroidota bacterium]|nr:beta-glucuronidase [Bacteroidota bacterium]